MPEMLIYSKRTLIWIVYTLRSLLLMKMSQGLKTKSPVSSAHVLKCCCFYDNFLFSDDHISMQCSAVSR